MPTLRRIPLETDTLRMDDEKALPVGIFNDTTPTRHFGCNEVMQNLDRELRRRGLKPSYYWPVAEDWRKHRTTLRSLDVAMTIVNGEGSIHDSATRERARFLPEIARFSKFELQVPSVLINCSITNLTRDSLDDIAMFNLVYTRETATQQYLAEHGISSEVVADLAVARPLALTPTAQARAGCIFLDSVDKEASSLLRDAAHRSGSPYSSLIPHKTTFERLKGWRKKLIPGFRLPRDFTPTANPDALLMTISSSRLVVTGRFHAVMFCLLTGTPFLAIESNTPKIGAVMEDIFGSKRRLIDRGELMEIKLLENDLENWQFTAEESSQVAQYLERHQKSRKDMFDKIKNLASR